MAGLRYVNFPVACEGIIVKFYSKINVILCLLIQEGNYFGPAKIVGLESGRHWYYTSCSTKGCFKKLDPNQGSLKCDKCFLSCPERTLRYRLIVRVVDKTSDAPLLLWDKECTELIGMFAFDLKSKYSQVYAFFAY